MERSAIIHDQQTLAEGDGLLMLVMQSLDDDKAEDIVAIDLAGKSTIGDYMVIATGRSQRQVSAMADHLIRKMKDRGVKGIALEGARTGDWVLVDAGDVIVHLFRPEVREFYGLEKMWGAQPPPSRTIQIGGEPQGKSGGEDGARPAFAIG
ncbi:MAG: ribosome silencing factor [Alphaproteobacteria bacterium]|nr:ribosome silencing factor [Alphaproteobacteria bacterium]